MSVFQLFAQGMYAARMEMERCARVPAKQAFDDSLEQSCERLRKRLSRSLDERAASAFRPVPRVSVGAEGGALLAARQVERVRHLRCRSSQLQSGPTRRQHSVFVFCSVCICISPSAISPPSGYYVNDVMVFM